MKYRFENLFSVVITILFLIAYAMLGIIESLLIIIISVPLCIITPFTDKSLLGKFLNLIVTLTHRLEEYLPDNPQDFIRDLKDK